MQKECSKLSISDLLLMFFRTLGSPTIRMPFRCKMCTDLMCTSCDQFYLKKSPFSIVTKRKISGLHRQSIFFLLFVYCYFIIFFVFGKISFDIFLLVPGRPPQDTDNICGDSLDLNISESVLQDRQDFSRLRSAR